MNRLAILVRPIGLALLCALATPSSAQQSGETAPSEATWAEIRTAAVGERPIQENSGLLTLGAPARAEDAALVPVEVAFKLPDGDPRRVTALTLVIDENPAPLGARFRFGDGKAAFALSTRVRVNSYSYLRAIAETSDGGLHMVKTYVKAAGGCSAAAVKDPAEAKANLGEMRFRIIATRGEAQVQIRHPNYSGLQMDQVTRLYTPAWYVETATVKQGEHPLFTMEGGISISEDPTFRFTYAGGSEPVTVEATDTEGRVFRRTFPGSDGS
jgi:sulfur-oxidizing protein SoxY